MMKLFAARSTFAGRGALIALALALAGAPAAAAAPPSFSISDARAAEGGAIVFTITKSAKAASYSKITVTTHGGRSATSGADFAPLSITVTFGNNELSKTVSVQTAQDQLVEGNEDFSVAIAAVRFAAIARGAATGTIVDDDVAPPPPPPPPAPVLTTGAPARAILACQAVNRPFDGLVIGQIYRVEGFGTDPAIGGFVILSDAAHLGDGYFSLYVPVGCVESL